MLRYISYHNHVPVHCLTTVIILINALACISTPSFTKAWFNLHEFLYDSMVNVALSNGVYSKREEFAL